MSWKDILKDSMARDLTADYGVDYIDRLTEDSTGLFDKLVNEALATLINKRLVTKDTSVSEIEKLMLQEKDNISAELYEGRMDVSLEEALDEHDEDLTIIARAVHRKIQKVADRYHLGDKK